MESIPNDIINIIIELLDIYDKNRFTKVCRKFNELTSPLIKKWYEKTYVINYRDPEPAKFLCLNDNFLQFCNCNDNKHLAMKLNDNGIFTYDNRCDQLWIHITINGVLYKLLLEGKQARLMCTETESIMFPEHVAQKYIEKHIGKFQMDAAEDNYPCNYMHLIYKMDVFEFIGSIQCNVEDQVWVSWENGKLKITNWKSKEIDEDGNVIFPGPPNEQFAYELFAKYIMMFVRYQLKQLELPYDYFETEKKWSIENFNGFSLNAITSGNYNKMKLKHIEKA